METNDDDYFYDTEGGFDDYVETSVDPGSSVLVSCLLFCILLLSLLPCLVQLGEKVEVRRQQQQQRGRPRLLSRRRRWIRQHSVSSGAEQEEEQQQQQQNDNNNNLKAVDVEPPVPEQAAAVGVAGGAANVSVLAPSDEEDGSIGDGSIISIRSAASSVARAIVTAVLDTSPHGNPIVHRARTPIQREWKREQRQWEQQEGLQGQPNDTGTVSSHQNQKLMTMNQQVGRGGVGSAGRSVGPNSTVVSSNGGGGGGQELVLATSNTTTLFGTRTISHDDISFHDAVDSHDPAYYSRHRSCSTTTNTASPFNNHNENTTGGRDDAELESNNVTADNNDFILSSPSSTVSGCCCCSNHKLCCSCFGNSSNKYIRDSYHTLLLVAEYDFETKRISKIAGPFMFQALLTGITEAIRVAMIGKFYGTNELAAYTVIDSLITLSSSVLTGFQDALIPVCSQAIGARNRTLAGEYIQISALLFIIAFIPFIIFWILYSRSVLLWLGLSEYIANIGQNYAIIAVFVEIIRGIDETIHALLDIIGLEAYSAFFVGLNDIISTLLVYFITYLPEPPSLQRVAYAYLFSGAITLCINMCIILRNGWFDRYLNGMIGTFALANIQAVRVFLGTSSSLSLGYLLTYGEWEILTVFASFLGPAEVAAWAMLGTLWDAVELVTEAAADAAEVRVAFLLGSGQPQQAKMSAYKSVYIGVFAAFFITSLLFIGGEDIPQWMTDDVTLQKLTAELIPLFGIGNIALTVGTMAWTIVGAQSRYRLSTCVGLMGSWCITMPLSAICSIVLHWNLQGQVGAVVIGYMVSGTINSYFLLRSNWEELSKKVIEQAGTEEEDSDDDSSDDSSSSRSSSDKEMQEQE